MAMLLLAAGGWYYLRCSDFWRRLLALLTGLTLATTVAATGKVVLYLGPEWSYPRHSTWQVEAMSTVILWAWLAVVLVAPALLHLVSHPDGRSPAGQETL